MTTQSELAIIVLGHKQSPFVKAIIDRDDLPVTWICSNLLDFQLYHADPAKMSTYHLEFTNLLELKAKNHIESLSIFETLGKFLEFYNPLKISTLNYLITKYITSINPSYKGLHSTWNAAVNTIFESNSMVPLFEESRVLHVKVDGVEIPVRQFIITKENEKKKEDVLVSKDSKLEVLAPARAVTGIIDLEEIEKIRLCNEAIKAIEQSPGLLIIPTDLISIHMLLRSEKLVGFLKTLKCKVTFLSPFWGDGASLQLEKELLEKTNINSSLNNLANKLKDIVDTFIIDERSSESRQKISETGMTVLLEKLDPVLQGNEQFLTRVLSTVTYDLESHKRKRQKKIVALGERIVSLLSDQFARNGSKMEQKPPEPTPVITPAPAAAPSTPQATVAVPPVTPVPAPAPAPSTPQATVAVPPVAPVPAPAPAPSTPQATVAVPAVAPVPAPAPAPSTPQAMVAVPAVAPVPAPAAATSTPQPPSISPANPVVIPPPVEQKPSPTKVSSSNEAKIDEIAPALLADLEKVIVPIYESKMEGIFSALLALVEKPRMLRAINKVLINKLEKLNEITPESRIIDIITYLAAHDPAGFTDLLSELISDAMKLDDNKQLGNVMHTVSLIMGASQVKRQEVLRDFIKESISSNSEFVIEKARKIINYFINQDPTFSVVICKTLIEILSPELESTKPNVALMNNLVFFLLSIDAILVGETIITDMPEAVHPRMKSLLEAVSCGQGFNKIVNSIIDAYQAGEYEALKKALNVKKVPAHVQIAVLKRKYVAQLLKAGSVPLEMFANKLGMSVPEAEKLIYEMILKGDISAKMEVVSGKLYIVKDEKTVAESSKTR